MKNILYIEDNDDNIYMLSGRLEFAGFSVTAAVDGESGVEMAAAKDGIDGWEACRRIKSCPSSSHIPIIALSSNASTEDRARSLAAGCRDFDTKPVDFSRLMRKIDACLR